MQDRVIWTNDTMSVNDGKLCMVPFGCNILYEYNLKNKEMEHCIVWENAHCQVGSSYNVIKFKDTFVVVPGRENVIRLVRNNELVREFKIAEDADLREHYRCALVVGDRLLLFPLEENTIIEIRENEMKKILSPMNLVSCTIIYDGDVLVANSSNCIWKYDVKTSTFEAIELDEDVQVCWMGVWGSNIILTTLNGRVLLANDGKLDELCEIAIAPEGDFFSAGIVQGNNLILFQHKDATNIRILNLTDMSMRNTLVEKDSFWLDWPYNSFGVPVEEQDKIYVMSPKHRALFILDEEGKVIERQHLFLDVNTKEGVELIKQGFTYSKMISECDVLYTLDNYLKYVVGNKNE